MKVPEISAEVMMFVSPSSMNERSSSFVASKLPGNESGGADSA